MRNLYDTLKGMNETEFNQFMQITFTSNERAMIEERWRIFDELRQEKSQREVAKSVPCSVVTVTRGAKVYRNYKNLIDRFLNKLQFENSNT